MRIYFDTEFTGLHQETTLISIGLVTEDGSQTFYAEFTDYDRSQIDAWLLENVIHNLTLASDLCGLYINGGTNEPVATCVRGNTESIKKELQAWLSQFDQIEMWSDCLAYDWVLFCELFGGGVECLPRNIYYIPFDLCTLFKCNEIDPDISRTKYSDMKNGKAHNALFDAMVIRACCEKVMTG